MVQVLALDADQLGRLVALGRMHRADVVEPRVAGRERVAGELRRQVADLSIDVAERVTGLALDEDSQRELVDRYIDELGGLS